MGLATMALELGSSVLAEDRMMVRMDCRKVARMGCMVVEVVDMARMDCILD